ncbi:MAG: vWA domain-containing protein, partial [Pseudomonadota bacterium]
GQEGDPGQDGDDTVPVDGAGDMPDVDEPQEIKDAQQEADGQSPDGDGDQPGQDADGEGADGEGMTSEELDQQIKQQQQAQGQDGGEPGQDGDSNSKSDQGSTGEGRSLEELSKESWHDYNARISELGSYITRVRKQFKKVQERQLQEKTRRSKQCEMLPENGEVVERLNIDRQMNLAFKRAIGNVEEEDYNRFHKDEKHYIPTTIDIVIMVDGSASMKGKALNSALQTAAILHEAANGKDMNVNVYVSMWGNENPEVLIEPGMKRSEIGRQLERARPGLSSGTAMAPAFKATADMIADQHQKSNTLAGFTHMLIVSDGDITDVAPSQKNIKEMFRHCKKVTVDVAVLDGKKGSAMERAVKDIQTSRKYQEVTVTLEPEPSKIPFAMVNMLLTKIRKCGSFKAEPVSKKKRDMRRASRNLGKRP